MSVRVTDRTRIQEPAAPVLPSAAAIARLNPLGGQDVSIAGGFWADRLRVNRERTLPHVFDQLVESGNLEEHAPRGGRERTTTGPSGSCSTARSRSSTRTSTSGSRASPGSSAAVRTRTLARMADEAIEGDRGRATRRWLPEHLRPGRRARPGVPGSPVRPRAVLRRHLIQAAVARHRALRETPAHVPVLGGRLASTTPSGRRARRGPTATPKSRWPSSSSTGRPARGDTSSTPASTSTPGSRPARIRRFGSPTGRITRRPRGAGGGRSRRAPSYLDAGAADSRRSPATRSSRPGGPALARHGRDEVLPHRWARRSRHDHEGFGDPTSCRTTAPTPRRARRSPASCSPGGCSSRPASPTSPTYRVDALQRLPARGLPRRHAPLLRQPPPAAHAPGRGRRGHRRAGPPWYACACCPPNLVRTFGSWPQYLATTDQGGVQVHQYATGEIPRLDPCGRRAARGRDRLPVGRSRAARRSSRLPDGPWTLVLRVPAWARSGAVDWSATSGDLPEASLPAPIREGGRARQLDAVMARRRRGGARPRHAGPPHRAGAPALTRAWVAWPRARSARLQHRVGRPARGRRARGRCDRADRPPGAGAATGRRARRHRPRSRRPSSPARARSTPDRGALPRVGQPDGRGHARLDPGGRRGRLASGAGPATRAVRAGVVAAAPWSRG